MARISLRLSTAGKWKVCYGTGSECGARAKCIVQGEPHFYAPCSASIFLSAVLITVAQGQAISCPGALYALEVATATRM